MKILTLIALCMVGVSAAVAATPTPTVTKTQNTQTWTCGGITGLLGYDPSQTVNPTLNPGHGVVSVKYGHQVSGSQCAPAPGDLTTANSLGLTFTRPSNNGLTYRIKIASVKMTDKTRARRSVDMQDCPYGPPTWGPTTEHKADRATVVWRRADGSTAGSVAHGAPGDGGTFIPPVVPHTVPQTDEVGNAAALTVTTWGTPPVVTPNPPAYQDGGPVEALDPTDDDRWRPENPNDPNNPNRSTHLDISTNITVRLAATAVEIVVPFDNSSSTVTVEAKIQ